MARRSENQWTITRWADETFGYATAASTADRCAQEAAEFIKKVAAWKASSGGMDEYELVEELADIYISGARMTSRFGMTLQGVIEEKMRINRERKWAVTPDGVGQHIPEGDDD